MFNGVHDGRDVHEIHCDGDDGEYHGDHDVHDDDGDDDQNLLKTHLNSCYIQCYYEIISFNKSFFIPPEKTAGGAYGPG